MTNKEIVERHCDPFAIATEEKTKEDKTLMDVDAPFLKLQKAADYAILTKEERVIIRGQLTLVNTEFIKKAIDGKITASEAAALININQAKLGENFKSYAHKMEFIRETLIDLRK